jgi:hypothetical protein
VSSIEGQQQRFADLFVAQAIAVNVHVGAQLDQRLDVGLPLILTGKTGGFDAGEQLLRAAGGAEQIGVFAVLWDAVPTLSSNDHAPPGANDARGCRHPFDRLIQIQIQRIARVGLITMS